MAILGVGHDVVDVPSFEEQLAQPGSHMRSLFSARELRQVAMRAQLKHDSETVHLAGKWAAKESVIKAWCAAAMGSELPYTLDTTPWSQIEILSDGRGFPQVIFGANVEKALRKSVGERNEGEQLQWHLSISHDGSIASAVVILESQNNMRRAVDDSATPRV